MARSAVRGRCAAVLAAALPLLAGAAGAATPDIAVGPQYDTTHVYVAPSDFSAFVTSFSATFGGTPSRRGVANVLPAPSRTELQYVWTPVGTLSVFGFLTPIPFPFGAERTGYLVADLDRAVAAAQAAGADLVVAPFRDPIGRDAVIRWPGGVMMQLYWHFAAPSYAPLATVPDNRVYLSPDQADAFLRDFLRFAGGRVVADKPDADAGEIGRPGRVYRRVRITSGFGAMQVMVTDGHLPYPFGREVTGYRVTDLAATLVKARAAGATVLTPPYVGDDRITAMVRFPGGYIAEIHARKSP
jgi:hypothetical protein